MRSQIFTNTKLISNIFILHFIELFFVMFSLVFAKPSFASVEIFDSNR